MTLLNEWKPKGYEILRHKQDKQHGTQRNEKTLPQEENLHYSEFNINYENYNKNLSAEEARGLWKLSSLSYEN